MADSKTTRGTGNVFADLGLPDAAERQTKTRLALAINRIIKDQRLKQVDAARLLGVPQAPLAISSRMLASGDSEIADFGVSALVNYRLDGFSVEKMMDFIVASHSWDLDSRSKRSA